MTIKETLLQGVRTWLRRAAVDDDTDLLHAQVIVADQKAPRPPIPYLMVRLLTPGQKVGHDERVYGVTGGGAPTMELAGLRRATVSVQGYGEATADWLEEAVIGLGRDSVMTLNRTSGISVEDLGDTANISLLVDTGIEPRFARDFAVLYAVRGGKETLVELLETQVGMTYTDRDGDPDPLITTIVA